MPEAGRLSRSEGRAPPYPPACYPATTPDAPGTTNPKAIGLRRDRDEQIALDTPAPGRQALAPYAIHDFSSYIGALYTVALENLNPTQPADCPRTISINTLGCGPKVRRISAAQKQQLVASGRPGRRSLESKRRNEEGGRLSLRACEAIAPEQNRSH